MHERTLTALKGSILKWEQIVAGTGFDKGADNCPLCDLFYNKSWCNGCPVKTKTGMSCCDGTPYQDEFVRAKRRRRSALMSYDEHDAAAAEADMHAAAKTELAFLKGLLP
jgi:hypothetical protein